MKTGKSEKISGEILAALEYADSIHPQRFHSSNEAAGVIREEYLELERELFHGSPDRAREEALQLGAMTIKTIRYLDSKTGGQ